MEKLEKQLNKTGAELINMAEKEAAAIYKSIFEDYPHIKKLFNEGILKSEEEIDKNTGELLEVKLI